MNFLCICIFAEFQSKFLYNNFKWIPYMYIFCDFKYNFLTFISYEFHLYLFVFMLNSKVFCPHSFQLNFMNFTGFHWLYSDVLGCTWMYSNVFKGVVGILALDWIANSGTSTQMQFSLRHHIPYSWKKFNTIDIPYFFMQITVSCIDIHSRLKGKTKPLRNCLHSSSVISSTYQRCKGLLKPLRIGFGPFQLALGFSCQLWTLQDCLRRFLVTERDRHADEELLLVAVGLILSMSVISGCDGSCVTAADILCYFMNTCCWCYQLGECVNRAYWLLWHQIIWEQKSPVKLKPL